MFSKSKINDPIDTGQDAASKPKAATPVTSSPVTSAAKPAPSQAAASAAASRSKPVTSGGPSIISPDLKVMGNLQTEGDLQIEGEVEGDIRANMLTIGEKATIRGEVVAEDVVVNGHVIGRIRGQKVRLASTGKVEGDILHQTIAIEAGAHFEGSVHRADDPLSAANSAKGSASNPAASGAPKTPPANAAKAS